MTATIPTTIPTTEAVVPATVPTTVPAGFRLARLEVFNWGTFDGRVWTFDVDGDTALLTGDIGSGKSTLVDALTTLLLPAQKVAYNKAAGADTKERDLRSYVLGHYKAERNESTGASRPVGLRRPGTTYSVLLARFADLAAGTDVTLAQVFWMRDGHQGQPERFFVVQDAPLTIAGHFAGFGTDPSALRRRLREGGARVHDHYPEYGRELRRRLGIASEQALELFHQTVSMKSVSDLNGFVRNHMLEPFDAKGWVDRLVTHFEDLSRAHAAVVRARDQLDRLTPLLEDCAGHDAFTAQIDGMQADRAALPYFCADRSLRLLEAARQDLLARESGIESEHRAVGSAVVGLRDRERQLLVEQAGYGGDRLAELTGQRERAVEERDRRQKQHTRFVGLLGDAGLDEPADAARFAALRSAVRDAAEKAEATDTELQNRRTDLEVTYRRLVEEGNDLRAELTSLANRRSNLPRQLLELRDRLAADLGLTPDDLPFVGELVQVRQDAGPWEGAAERVLRSFALGLLVAAEHYPAVSDWIDRTHLGLRLVYFKVPQTVVVAVPPAIGTLRDGTAADPLHGKLEIRTDSRFYDWLERELWRRADHHCATSVEQFRTCEKAVTRAGQVRSGNRHEKDDRRAVDDRRHYVLGWDPQAKIDALLRQATDVQARRNEAVTAQADLAEQLTSLAARRLALSKLAEIDDWDSLDWQDCVVRIARLDVELHALEASSRDLARVRADLETVRGEIEAAEERRGGLDRRLGGVRAEIDDNRRSAALARERLEDPAAEPARTRFETLMARCVRDGLATRSGVGPQDYDEWSVSVRRDLDETIARRGEQRRLLAGRIGAAMHRFRTDFPAETTDMDAAVEAAGEYRALRDRLLNDDLPRFEAEFKTYLNTNTIRDVAGFQSALTAELDLIRERVDRINESLRHIDYNPGRYIRLETQLSPNVEVRDFRQELRACTDNALGGDDADQYSEAKFLQVARLIERFRGRSGQTDADQAWTRRVTDVRNWVVFVATERYREDDAEHETYADTSGKSGGQKEKLAYTILAASLVYQFKLEGAGDTSKNFRFVVIDEAFGRGSDESTRYGLDLFRTLGLQLLIVTPLQKIQIIAPYVAAVGFVDNRTGSSSRIQTLTIEEFRERQATFAGVRSRVLGVDHLGGGER